MCCRQRGWVGVGEEEKHGLEDETADLEVVGSTTCVSICVHLIPIGY